MNIYVIVVNYIQLYTVKHLLYNHTIIAPTVTKIFYQPSSTILMKSSPGMPSLPSRLPPAPGSKLSAGLPAPDAWAVAAPPGGVRWEEQKKAGETREHMEVSIDWGTQKWMVYTGKSQSKMV